MGFIISDVISVRVMLLHVTTFFKLLVNYLYIDNFKDLWFFSLIAKYKIFRMAVKIYDSPPLKEKSEWTSILNVQTISNFTVWTKHLPNQGASFSDPLPIACFPSCALDKVYLKLSPKKVSKIMQVIKMQIKTILHRCDSVHTKRRKLFFSPVMCALKAQTIGCHFRG